MRPLPVALATLLALLVAGSSPSFARAQPRRLSPSPNQQQTLIEVSVLHATRDHKGRDPRIGEMPELEEAPFSGYDSYELLSRRQLALVKGGKQKLQLPNGRQLETRLEDVLPGPSIRLVASISRPGVAAFLPFLEVKARPGQSFIVAGQNYRRGVLVLVFKVLR